MPVVIELLNKGLVTARDPALLRPGELQRCDDCIYHPNDQAIWKAPGRVIFADQIEVSAFKPVKGLRYLDFDKIGGQRGEDYVIAHVSGSATGLGSYFYSAIPTAQVTFPPSASSFNLLTSACGDGDTLDTVHYNNRYYLFNGNLQGIANVVVKPATASGSDPVIRDHGLKPVTIAPTVASASGYGWMTEEQSFGDGYYFFITTEVVNPDSADEVESTWAGDADDFSISRGTGVIYVSGTANGVTVTQPPPTNSTATHWRVYLHGPEKTPDWNQAYLATMYRQTTEKIVSSAPYSSVGIGSNVGGLGYYIGTARVTATAERPTANMWDNEAFITGYGGGAATSDTEGELIIVSAFSLPTASITGTVWGISVQAQCKIDFSSVSYLDVQLYHNSSPSGYTDAGLHSILPKTTWSSVTVGGATDRWGKTWTASDFSDANFKVKLTYRRLLPAIDSVDIDVDYIRVAVNSGSAGVLSKAGPMFPYTAIQIGNIITIVGSNGPPPIASTGDIYEGQMVVNDITDPNKIWYSLPDGVDYFPAIYFISFETKENDEVTFIRRLGDKLVVGLRHQLYRVNYLPRGEDSEFDRGRCYEAISEDHGVCGLQAGTLFSPPDRSQLLAYVSTNGIHATDGFTTTTLTEDLDWPHMVKVSELSKSILINYPKYSSLVLYYIPYGSDMTYPTRALWFNYHPSHIKEGGKLLVSGPTKLGEEGGQTTCSSCIGKFLNDPFMLTGRNDGMVFVEDVNFVDEGGLGILPDIVTRDIYAAGIGYEYTIERLWFRHYQHLPASTVLVTPYWRNTEGEYMTPATGVNYTQKSFTTARGAPIPGSAEGLINGGCLSRIDQHLIAESFAFRLQEVDGNSGVAISWMAMEAEGHGLEEKR